MSAVRHVGLHIEADHLPLGEFRQYVFEELPIAEKAPWSKISGRPSP